MLLLIGGKEVLPIMGRHRLFLHVLWLCKRSFRINIEVSIIGMLLFEIVFWFYLWITLFEDIEKACLRTHRQMGNNLLYLSLGKLGTYPDDETGWGLPPVWFFNYINLTSVGGQAF